MACLNADGHIAVNAKTAAGYYHACIWLPNVPNASAGRLVDLGTLGGATSHANVPYGKHYCLNSHTVLVGYSDLANGASHGFRWDLSTMQMRDINDSTLTPIKGAFSYFEDGACINDGGFIAGRGLTLKGGQERAYLLTPK